MCRKVHVIALLCTQTETKASEVDQENLCTIKSLSQTQVKSNLSLFDSALQDDCFLLSFLTSQLKRLFSSKLVAITFFKFLHYGLNLRFRYFVYPYEPFILLTCSFSLNRCALQFFFFINLSLHSCFAFTFFLFHILSYTHLCRCISIKMKDQSKH